MAIQDRSRPGLGFVGLGTMGGRMAARLCWEGWEVAVFDVDPAAVERVALEGARPAASPSDVAAASDVVLTSLPSPKVLGEVLFGGAGLIHGGRAKIIIDLSTVGPKTSQRAAADLAGHGIDLVDSPVSGSPLGVAEGRLTLMVSGTPAALEQVRPILETLGQRVVVVGDRPGLAQTMKLVNNFLSAAALAASAEAVVMGVKAGLDPSLMMEVLNAGSGKNSATLDKIPNDVIPRTFNHGFSIGLLYKDVRLYLDEAEGLGIPAMVGSAVSQLWMQAKLKSGEGSDCTRIFELLEDWGGVTHAPDQGLR